MQTVCPDCDTNLLVGQPGTDPAASIACTGCGNLVKPGAFECPGCQTGLQVERSLLPPEGGHGRCPECSGTIWVAPLSSLVESSDSGAPPAEAPSTEAAPAEPVAGEAVAAAEADPVDDPVDPYDELTGDDDVLRDDEILPDPAPFPSQGATERPGAGGRMFVGGVIGAAAMSAVILAGVWNPPALPWGDAFPFAGVTSWSAAAGFVVAVLALMTRRK